MLIIITYAYFMLAGVTLMFASLGTFNLPPMHHYINIFLFAMGFACFAVGYIGAWRHKC
jgi:formate hydrogenlyase subunit 3/multisubunit Na+/H+ antiporter MnhD subunit